MQYLPVGQQVGRYFFLFSAQFDNFFQKIGLSCICKTDCERNLSEPFGFSELLTTFVAEGVELLWALFP